jgi:hypothetical protein
VDPVGIRIHKGFHQSRLLLSYPLPFAHPSPTQFLHSSISRALDC